MLNFEKIYQKYNDLTEAFFKDKSLADIKEKSQYFTPGEEVDKMLDDLIIIDKDVINILDPSCGHGLLVIKLVEKLIKEHKYKKILIHAYDTDDNVLTNFKSIFESIEFKKTDIDIEILYFKDDFLKSKPSLNYDYIIMNPPYKKMVKSDVHDELKIFLDGQPNAYHLFIAKCLKYLAVNGTLCVISPKNYLSGRYTELLRKYIFEKFSIYKIHTFNNRHSIFSHKITQEICIVHIRNFKHSHVISSYNGNEKLILPIDNLKVNNDTNIIQTPRNLDDYKLIQKFMKFPIGLSNSSIIMNTGKIVQFRVSNKDSVLKPKSYLCYSNGIPLIVYRHINNGSFDYCQLVDKKNNTDITLLDDKTNSLKLIDNRNYLLVRKNTDKKYSKLIHAVPYLRYLETDFIAIDNGLAYFSNSENTLTETEIKGLQCILMSEQFDNYYRMFNSSHTLNIYEFENMHFPDLKTIRAIAQNVNGKEITLELATEIMDQYL